MLSCFLVPRDFAFLSVSSYNTNNNRSFFFLSLTVCLRNVVLVLQICGFKKMTSKQNKLLVLYECHSKVTIYVLFSLKTISWKYSYLLENDASLLLEDWKRFIENSPTQRSTEIWSNRIFQTIATIEIEFFHCLWPATPNTCCLMAISSRSSRIRFSETWEIHAIYLCPH